MTTLLFVPDSKKSAVLSGWAPEYGEVELLDGLLKAGETIGASSIRARFALSLIELHCGSAEKMGMILSSVKRIGSDYVKAKVLGAATDCLARGDFIEDRRVSREFFGAVDGIGSDSIRASLLSAVAKQSAMGKSTLLRIIESTERLGNDSIKAGVLLQIALVPGKDAEVSMRLRQSAATIGSSHAFHTVFSPLEPNPPW